MGDDGEWVSLLAAAAIAEGEVVGTDHGERKIALYRLAGAYYATDNVCTHSFALLSDGWVEGDCIRCPLHGGRFDIATGKAQRVPVTRDIVTFRVRIIDGILQVWLPLSG